MSTNPYAPPLANVEDVPRINASPALWNPGAAARWSLLFSPIFGAIIQMKNWQALGEPENATKSKQWALGSIGFFVFVVVLGLFFPDSKALDLGFRGAGLGLLIAWYSLSSKRQAAFVAARFGTSYTRKGWGRPLGYAALSIFAFFALLFVVAFAIGMLQGEG